MTEQLPDSMKKLSADWFLRGALAKVGDAIDRFTGRRGVPSSNLAISELIGRLKALLDAESMEIPGKGFVVPHKIRLKIQWDKVSTDSDEALPILERELLVAAADHINDSLYFTFAPLDLKVTPDYFTEGIMLFASFDNFIEIDDKHELSITFPNFKTSVSSLISTEKPLPERIVLLASIDTNGKKDQAYVEVPSDGRISIGRSGGNQLEIDDPSVSKIHATLSIGPGAEISVADTGSTNGTFINSQRMPYGRAFKLEPSDIVKFGNVEVMFVVESRSAENQEKVSDDILDEKADAIGESELKAETSYEQGESQPVHPTTIETKITSESDKECE